MGWSRQREWVAELSADWQNYMIQLRSSTQAIIIGGGEEATQRKTAVKEWDDNIQDDVQIPQAAEYFAKLPSRDFIGWEGDSAESMTWTGGELRLSCRDCS